MLNNIKIVWHESINDVIKYAWESNSKYYEIPEENLVFYKSKDSEEYFTYASFCEQAKIKNEFFYFDYSTKEIHAYKNEFALEKDIIPQIIFGIQYLLTQNKNEAKLILDMANKAYDLLK